MIDTTTGLRALILLLGASAALVPSAAALPVPAPAQDDGARAPAGDEADDEQDEARPKTGAARGFEHVLPADTQVFLGVADLEAWQESLSEQPWGQLWADPACAALRTEFERRLKDALGAASEKLEVDLEGALDGLQGGFAIAASVEAPEGEELLDDNFEKVRLSLTLVAGLAEDHAVLERTVGQLLEKLDTSDEDLVLRTVEIGEWDASEVHGENKRGGTLDVRAVFTDDTLVFEFALNGGNAFQAVLDELDGQGSGSVLADDSRFSGSVASRPGGVQMWIDAQTLCALARPGLQAMTESKSESSRVTGGVLLRSGLLDIVEIAASSAVDENGARSDLRVRWPAGGWLHEVIERLFVPGTFDTLADIQGDAVSITAMHVDFAGLFDVALKEVLATGTVEMSEVVDMLSGFEAGTGFALRDDLLESLSGEVSFVTCEVDPTEALPGGEAAKPYNFVLLLGLKDGAAFTTLLEDLVRSRGLHAARERIEFQGFELFNVPVFPGYSVNYAVLPDKFVASLSPTLVQEVLRRNAGADLPRYSERKDLAALLDRLSPGLGLLSTGDAAQNAYSTVLSFIGGLTGVASVQGPNPVTALFVDLPIPELSVFEQHFKGLIAVAVTVDAEGITMESVGP